MSASDIDDQRLLLIDGHAMAFRAFFALPADGFSDGRGQATNAVYGFVRMLINVVASERPTHLAVAFDLPGGTFRDRIYDQYKGGRDETPEAFHGQIGLIMQVLDALGVRWLTYEDYEADDIIATLATRAEEAGHEALIVSSDRDAIQLVGEKVTLLQPVKGVTEMRRMTPAAVEEKYGLAPERYPDLAALVGEAADNLPGVPGVGPKTAAKWIVKYGDLPGVIAHADEITGKAGQSLRDHLADVERNRLMNAACTTLDLPADAEHYALGHGDRARVMGVFDDLAFGDTIRRDLPAVLLGEEPEEGTAAAPEETATLDVRDAASLEALLAAGTELLALDVVEDVRGGAMMGLATPTTQGAILLGALDSEATEALAAALAAAEEIRVADAPFVRSWLGENGYPLGGRLRDLSLESFVLRPGARSYDAEALGSDLGGASFAPRPRRPAPSTLAKESAEVRAEHVAAAGDRLATAAAALHPAAEELTARLGEAPWALTILDELERPLQAVLETMHERGIAIDTAALGTLREEFEGFVAQAKREAGQLVGEEVNLASPKQLQVVLFDTLALPTTRKISSGHSTDAESLTDLQESLDPESTGHQFLSWLLRFREMSKLTGYLVGLDKVVDTGSRVHTTFQQTAAATGRLASTEPNLQNIPVRTAEGQRIRDVFVAGEGFETLLTADYSQIEMRIMAHLSEDEGLIEAFRSGEDLHNFVASRVFGVSPDAVDPAMRSKTKAVSYGLAYGLSAFGLSRQLRISRAEATALRDGYFERFGGVRDYLHHSVETARSTGYTETLLGRRRYLPDLTSDNRQRRENAERVALNSPIQGSAADLIKLAMLAVESRMREAELRSRMLLQVHDELVVEVAPGELDRVREIVEEGMDSAYELSVPLEVGVGIGRTWREAAH
ncbi:DNA polymerase I [Brachybacterium saurashtrense]|uniref:DNA polymerase I n=1 Tax=Brachybacterium saurashtrense TaxID=556288 RepID=A0A345YM78_9MICO|nr:DNA polymerase I [Brachybacterium saurashtrense]AXK45030.1 DNA polymerase I [Brachybacterium saurashtrense]RRR21714.1 DNA polymerase I [Brachybacterium saurashtrense]